MDNGSEQGADLSKLCAEYIDICMEEKKKTAELKQIRKTKKDSMHLVKVGMENANLTTVHVNNDKLVIQDTSSIKIE